MKKQKIKIYLLLPVLLLAIFTLAGCGKSALQKATEKTAEKIIEEQSGGNANVDINEGNVKIESEQGKVEIGENAELPADFPEDVYVIDGKIVMANSDKVSGSLSVSLETDKSTEEASSIYQEKLKAEGWNITNIMNLSGLSNISAEKDNRNVSVIIGESNGKTSINITIMKK